MHVVMQLREEGRRGEPAIARGSYGTVKVHLLPFLATSCQKETYQSCVCFNSAEHRRTPIEGMVWNKPSPLKYSNFCYSPPIRCCFLVAFLSRSECESLSRIDLEANSHAEMSPLLVVGPTYAYLKRQALLAMYGSKSWVADRWQERVWSKIAVVCVWVEKQIYAGHY